MRLGDAHADEDTQEALDFLSCALGPANQARIEPHNRLDQDTHSTADPVVNPEFRIARMT